MKKESEKSAVKTAKNAERVQPVKMQKCRKFGMDQSCAARTEKEFFENSKPLSQHTWSLQSDLAGPHIHIVVVISVALLTGFLSASTLESSHLST